MYLDAPEVTPGFRAASPEGASRPRTPLAPTAPRTTAQDKAMQFRAETLAKLRAKGLVPSS